MYLLLVVRPKQLVRPTLDLLYCNEVATIEALLDAREKLSYILPGIAIHNGSKSIMKKKMYLKPSEFSVYFSNFNFKYT